MAKQTSGIPWHEIKKRYLKGDKPKDIASDYGLTAKQVSDKAHAEKWTRKKSEISAKIDKFNEEEIIYNAQTFKDLSLELAIKILREAVKDPYTAANNQLVKAVVTKGLDAFKGAPEPPDPNLGNPEDVSKLSLDQVRLKIKKIIGKE